MQVNDTLAAQHNQLLAELATQGQNKDKLQQSDFLMLMIAQLQNQDPLSPLSNEEFVGQITQFNILNEVTTFNQSLARMEAFQATGLIGQYVEGFIDIGVMAEGKVVEVILGLDTATLVLEDGTLMPLAGLLRVLPPGDDSTDSSGTASGTGTLV